MSDYIQGHAVAAAGSASPGSGRRPGKDEEKQGAGWLFWHQDGSPDASFRDRGPGWMSRPLDHKVDSWTRAVCIYPVHLRPVYNVCVCLVCMGCVW